MKHIYKINTKEKPTSMLNQYTDIHAKTKFKSHH